TARGACLLPWRLRNKTSPVSVWFRGYHECEATIRPPSLVPRRNDMKFHAALALLVCVGLSTANAQTSDKVVKISATADKPDDAGNQTVTITVEIDKPWHIYANPVGNDMLAPVQTKVTFKDVEDAKITYPPG